MDHLTFHIGQPQWRYISFSHAAGLRVEVLTDANEEEVYELSRDRAAELWKWLGDFLSAPAGVCTPTGPAVDRAPGALAA